MNFKQKIRRNIAGMLSLAAAHFGGAANADHAPTIYMPEMAFGMVEQHGANPNALQWDSLRERDIVGHDTCFDDDEDGIADTAGAKVIQGDRPYTLVVFTGEADSEFGLIRGVTKQQAMIVLQQGAYNNPNLMDKTAIYNHGYASGLLIDRQNASPGQAGQLEAVYSVMANRIENIARPNSNQPTGDLDAGYVSCNSVRIPSGYELD